ncbi:barstar family protein [uncultured Friedmanniella sp.]|uniref:barstar family protein n=1 Tax=uncultured Friedmanniella sp. TaxID=335381 RepID=UPI0035CB9182
MDDIGELMSVGSDTSFLAFRGTVRELYNAVLGWTDSGLVARVARGYKIEVLADLMNEVSPALQFSYYFGENWSAAQDCLNDMDWLPRGDGVVVAISDASQVLSRDHVEDFETLIRSLVSAMAIYSHPVNEGAWWDRPAVPFHVVLHFELDDVSGLDAWRAAGAVVVPMIH